MPLRWALLVLLAARVEITVAGNWNEAESLELLGYAQASYCRTGLDTFDCGAVCSSLPPLTNLTVAENSTTDGLAYVGYNSAANRIIVSFRGTVATALKNWWSDLSSLKLVVAPQLCPPSDCMVGEGFLNAYEALRHAVLASIKSLLIAHPGGTVSVTGHSLGASLAHICALDLKQQAIPVDAAVTFGAPRTGNKPFSEYYSERLAEQTRYAWRVTHYRDPIVHLPALSSTNGPWHVPREMFFNETTGLLHRTCDVSGEDSRCSSGTMPLPSTRDHLHYLDMHLGTYACPK